MPETLMDIARSYSTDGSPKRLAREAVIAQVEIVRLMRARVRDLEGENEARQAAMVSDTIMVTRLDRLARSTRDLLKTLDRLAKARVGFKSLRETAVDTTTEQGRLVVSILSAISEFERELILSRISEGRKRARQNGIKFGRKPKLTAYQRQEALERLAEGESQSTIARSFNVDRATISRLDRR